MRHVITRCHPQRLSGPAPPPLPCGYVAIPTRLHNLVRMDVRPRPAPVVDFGPGLPCAIVGWAPGRVSYRSVSARQAATARAISCLAASASGLNVEPFTLGRYPARTPAISGITTWRTS